VDGLDALLGDRCPNGVLAGGAVENANLRAMLHHIREIPGLNVMGQVIAETQAENASAAKGVFILIFPFHQLHPDEIHDVADKMMLVGAEPRRTGPLVSGFEFQGPDLVAQVLEPLIQVLEVMDGFERNLHAVGRSERGKGAVTLIMHEHHFAHPQALEMIDHLGQPLFNDRRVGEVNVDDVAEELLAEHIGRQKVFKEFSPHRFQVFRHIAEGQDLVLDLAHLVFSLGFSDVDPLLGDRPWGDENAFFLAPLGNQIKRVIPSFAVLLAGIAGDAVLQHKGILSFGDLDHLLFCCFPAHVKVLTLDEAVTGWTGLAEPSIKLELNHRSSLLG